MQELVEGVVEAGSFEFDDFERFRESIRGWDTDPFQLTPGRLRLTHDYLRADDLTVARIRANQRIADSSAIQSGGIVLVMALSQKTCCGVEVAPGSVVVMGAGRDYRNVLSVGWESIEISVSEELLEESGLLWSEMLPRNLAPESCVYPLPRKTVRQVHAWGSRLFGTAAPSLGTTSLVSGAIDLEIRAAEARDAALATILPSLFQPRLVAMGIDSKAAAPVRRRSDKLVEQTIRTFDALQDERPTVEQLAGEAGVSRRTLELAFGAVLSCSPSRFFRIRRLIRVRRDLLRGISVTEAALAHHFVSLGRFSELYRRQFRELPSETSRHLTKQRAIESVTPGTPYDPTQIN